MMDIGQMQGAYGEYLAKQASTKLDSRIKEKDYSQSSDEELLSACKEFEAYFLEQVFKEMQKTVDVFKDEETSPNKNLVDYFQGNALQDLAGISTETQGLGFAQMMFEQMKRDYNI